MTQKNFISDLLKKNKEAVVVGSLGSISKDLEEIGHKNLILVKGAMGCALAVGLGYALNSTKKVIVLIGEGSMLMKLGSLATLARYKPKNLELIILNNGVYASTGGQKNNWDRLFTNDGRFIPCGPLKSDQKG